MARKVNKPVEVELEEQEDVEAATEDDSPEASVTRDWRGSMSKAGAARAALAEGYYVPKQASAYIKEKWGIDISPQQFSAEKSRIKLRAGGASSFGPGGILPNFAALAGGPRGGIPGEADLLQALELMKPLVEQLGADKVKRMVDLLG